MTKTITVFTIATKSYFHLVICLAQSLMETHPELTLQVLVVDQRDDEFIVPLNINIYWVEEQGIPDFERLAFKYDVTELCTAVKPFFMKILLKDSAKVVYLDPDIYLFNRLDSVLDRLESSSVILTPHQLTVVNDGLFPSDSDLLTSGAYNLGFFAATSCETTLALLDWWWEKCRDLCYADRARSLFVDQKWMDLAPSFFSGVCIEKHPGLNVAYWNLHERRITKNLEVEFQGQRFPLIFFHFSGAPLRGQAISKHFLRYSLETRPDLAELFHGYRSLALKNRTALSNLITYSYANFSNGRPIPPMLRRAYGLYPQAYGLENPFSQHSRCYRSLGFLGRLSIFIDGIQAYRSTVQTQLGLRNRLYIGCAVLLTVIVGRHGILSCLDAIVRIKNPRWLDGYI